MTLETTETNDFASVADLIFRFGKHEEKTEQLGRDLAELNAALDAANKDYYEANREVFEEVTEQPLPFR